MYLYSLYLYSWLTFDLTFLTFQKYSKAQSDQAIILEVIVSTAKKKDRIKKLFSRIHWVLK